jgi:hypothetical protein
VGKTSGNGLDPSVLKRALGKHAFIAAMGEWEVSQSLNNLHHRRVDREFGT